MTSVHCILNKIVLSWQDYSCRQFWPTWHEFSLKCFELKSYQLSTTSTLKMF